MGELYKRSYQDKTGQTKMAPKWYADYSDGNGVRKRVSLFKDKAASLAKLAELERTADRGRAGLTDKFEDWRKVPLSKHLTDWKRSMEAQGVVDGGGLTSGRAERLAVEAKAVFIADLVPSKIVEALVRLTQTTGIGIQTQNFYLVSIKQFARWLERDGRIQSNPLKHLQGKNVKLDRRHDRRALSHEEAAWLLRTTRQAKTRWNLSGLQRFWLYRVAMATGLRASELASLTPQSFGGGQVTVEAAYAKNRRKDSIPLPEYLNQELAEWLALLPVSKPVWPGSWVKNRYGGKALKKDLLEARQAWLAQGGDPEADTLLWKDSKGLFADFHALRHTAVTWAVLSGANIKAVQSFARHSTITLTLDRYTTTNQGDLKAVVEGVKDPMATTEKGFYCAVTVPLLCQKPAIQKTRLILVDTAAPKVEASETTRKQAFGGVSPRIRAMHPVGFEPTTPGLGNRCSIP